MAHPGAALGAHHRPEAAALQQCALPTETIRQTPLALQHVLCLAAAKRLAMNALSPDDESCPGHWAVEDDQAVGSAGRSSLITSVSSSAADDMSLIFTKCETC